MAIGIVDDSSEDVRMEDVRMQHVHTNDRGMRHGRLFSLLLPALVAIAAGCGQSQSAPGPGEPSGRYCCDAVDSLITASIELRRFPAAAVAVGTERGLLKSHGYGTHTYSDSTAVSDRSLFDLASLTKVVATTTSIMILHERGEIDLDERVAAYLPAFAENGKGDVTIRQLLRHRGGLTPFHRFYMFPEPNRDTVINGVLGDSLYYPPGGDERYSESPPMPGFRPMSLSRSLDGALRILHAKRYSNRSA